MANEFLPGEPEAFSLFGKPLYRSPMRAEIYEAQKKRYEEAVKKLEEASSLLPDPIVLDHLGDAYLKQEDIIKAKESWQKSLEISGDKDLGIKEKLEKYK